MNKSCENRVAIVTGAGRGIGREHALMLASEGAKVVVNDLGGDESGHGADLTPAQEVVNEIVDMGGEAIVNGCNVADFDAAGAMIQEAIDKWGRIDILVNNAGILRDRMLFSMSEDDWDAVINVHLKGTFAPTHHASVFWRESVKAGGETFGRVINTSSPSGIYGNVGQTNYGAAKAGIAGFSRSLALEVAKYKCTVNTISPGAATRLTIDLIEAAGREYDENDWTQGPEQIAPVVTWLCSEEANDITSQIIHSQGGILGIMQQPAVIKSFTSDNLWTIDQLNQLMPELIEAKKHHDAEVEEKGKPSKT